MVSINAPVREHMTSLGPVWADWQARLPEVLAK